MTVAIRGLQRIINTFRTTLGKVEVATEKVSPEPVSGRLVSNWLRIVQLSGRPPRRLRGSWINLKRAGF